MPKDNLGLSVPQVFWALFPCLPVIVGHITGLRALDTSPYFQGKPQFFPETLPRPTLASQHRVSAPGCRALRAPQTGGGTPCGRRNISRPLSVRSWAQHRARGHGGVPGLSGRGAHCDQQCGVGRVADPEGGLEDKQQKSNIYMSPRKLWAAL